MTRCYPQHACARCGRDLSASPSVPQLYSPSGSRWLFCATCGDRPEQRLCPRYDQEIWREISVPDWASPKRRRMCKRVRSLRWCGECSR